MKAFLTIDEKSRLELRDLDNKKMKRVIFDINADYDDSVKSFATFLSVNGIKSVTTSSSIDFPDDYGIDEAMLDGFFNSVKTYEVA